VVDGAFREQKRGSKPRNEGAGDGFPRKFRNLYGSDPGTHCFADCRTSIVPQWWTLGDPDELLELIQQATVRAAATLRAPSPEALVRIRQDLREIVSSHAVTGGYRLPMSALVASVWR